MKPGFHCVTTHWIPGFMGFQLTRRTTRSRRPLPAAAGQVSGRERRTGSAGAERKDDQPRSETPPEPVNRVEVQAPGQP
jgi:hypothetical protein